jgi:hypothetical protein
MSYRPTIGGRLREETSGVDRSQAGWFWWGPDPVKESIMQATTKLWRLGILALVAFHLLCGVSPAASNEPTFTTIDSPGSTFTEPMGSTLPERSWGTTSMPMAWSMAFC